ncbi:hypothetical protein J4W31_14355, partial [Escherichia coli]
MDYKKVGLNNKKKIIHNKFAKKIDVDQPENKQRDLNDLENNVEKRLQNRKAKYQNEINQLS